MGKINKGRPNLSRLNESARGDMMSAQEAIDETRKLASLSDYEICDIPVDKLDPMKYNEEIYSISDFDFLGATIKQFGILQPLVAWKQPNNDRYWIVAGERRFRSYVGMLQDEKVAAMYPNGLPCHVFPESVSLIEIKMMLIVTNATSRSRDQVVQFDELKALVELFEEADKHGIDIGFSFRELAMSKLQISERQYQKYVSAMNVIPALAEHAEEAKVDLNLTSAIGSKPDIVQEEILERVENGESISKAYQDVNAQYKKYKKEEKELSETISTLYHQVAEIEAQEDMGSDGQGEKIQKLKAELKEQKKKKKDHRKNIKEAIKKKESSEKLDKTENANSVRSETIPRKHDPYELNDLLIPKNDAMIYIEKSTRALFIHAEQLEPEDVMKLHELKAQLDATIQKAEASGGQIVV